MKAREVAVTLVALAAIGVTSFWAYRYENRREGSGVCALCDRRVHAVTAYRLQVAGRVVAACCPRCGMHAQMNQALANSGAAWATDVVTGAMIPAESATYVEAGDVQYCTHDDQPMARDSHGVSVRDYDRCLPTLVAFKTPQEAEVYQQQHGGHVLSYAQALASVKTQ